MKNSFCGVLLVLFAMLVGCSSPDTKMQEKPVKTAPYPGELTVKEEIKTSSGLKYIDMVEGDGSSPRNGRRVIVQYTGYLLDGTKFDSSVDKGEPLSFIMGAHGVIQGWEEGIMTMNIGGKRKLIVPPELGYGAEGYPGFIPGNAVTVFDIELVDVQ